MSEHVYSTDIRINGQVYKIVDAIEYITLADSFVKNKIGRGNGEAKLYVGSQSEILSKFFDRLAIDNCFFCRKDFSAFLADAEPEYRTPQQEYIRKAEMSEKFDSLKDKLETFNQEVLRFTLYHVDVAPPRIYMNSRSFYYSYMRDIGLPNISYLSVLKLLDKNDNTHYYFKIFIDYRPDIIGYQTMEEEQQVEKISAKGISEKKKQALINARIGQGEYRNKLLEECPFCPFTMVNDERLLIASHIKPWAKADDKEKVDPKNGFMFTPTYDKLFDKGFITFNQDKTLVVSPWISPMNQKRLGIFNGKHIQMLPLDEAREEYLKYHREFIYKG